MQDESTILSTINATTFKRKERSTLVPLEQNVLLGDFYFVVDPTPWTIIKKARKESTKLLKVGGLYVRFDLANKEQETIRMYFKSLQRDDMLLCDSKISGKTKNYYLRSVSILLNFALQIT